MSNDTPNTTAPAPSNQQSKTKVKLSGVLEIGSANIPLSSDDGIDSGQFSYDRKTSDSGDIIFEMSNFCSAFSIKQSDLPTSLASLALKVETVEVDIKAKYYELIVDIGEKGPAATGFSSSWTPIPDFDDFKLNNMRITVTRGTKPTVSPANKTDAGGKS